MVRMSEGERERESVCVFGSQGEKKERARKERGEGSWEKIEKRRGRDDE